MSKETKKAVRAAFRAAVFARDGHRCRVCVWRTDPSKLDVHHISDRSTMAAGGYVAANGIALCPDCHRLAELHHNDPQSAPRVAPNYAPDVLYRLINSSHARAVADSLRLGGSR